MLRLRCFTLLLMVLKGACAAESSFAEPPAPTHANVSYGDHPRQVLDVYRTPVMNEPAPWLFYIHGGGWMAGDKSKPDFLEQALRSGISVVAINYRFIPDAIAAKIDPPVKAPLEDAARALQFARFHAEEWGLDKARVAAYGGSAGGCSSLWLAYHDEMADPTSEDPVRRESTRVTCVMGFVPQTTLDPKLVREWIPNNMYGHHAFGLRSEDAFLARRDELLPQIELYSPLSLATRDDPPTYLFYDSLPQLGQPQKDPPHSANLGVRLAEKLRELNVPCEFNHQSARDIPHPNIFEFFVEHLRGDEGDAIP